MIARVKKIVQGVKIWHLVLLLSVLLPLTAWQLRLNNVRMVELRNEVVRVDSETGDINQVEPHLIALGNHVLNHMNTRLSGPIELPGSYNNAVEAARAEVEQSGTANGQVYRDAQDICERPTIPLTARAQCIQEYVLSNAVPGTDVKELVFPNKSLYSYNFSSPAISLDAAGILTFTTIILGLGVAAKVVLEFAIPFIRKSVANDPLE